MFPHEYRRALQEQAEADEKSVSSQLSRKMTPNTPSLVLNGVNEELPSSAKEQLVQNEKPQPVQNGKLEPVQNDVGGINTESSSSLASSSMASTGSEMGVFSDPEELEDFVEDPINPLTDVGSTQIKVVGDLGFGTNL